MLGDVDPDITLSGGHTYRHGVFPRAYLQRLEAIGEVNVERFGKNWLGVRRCILGGSPPSPRLPSAMLILPPCRFSLAIPRAVFQGASDVEMIAGTEVCHAQRIDNGSV